MNECFYDKKGVLVDKNHKYSWCEGTPDQYNGKTDPIKHFTIDSGGIVREGVPEIYDSIRHAINSTFFDEEN
jgi:hypothetical protein